MLKQILNLDGARELNSTEQTEINGGLRLSVNTSVTNCSGQPHGTPCTAPDGSCPGICSGGICAMF